MAAAKGETGTGGPRQRSAPGDARQRRTSARLAALQALYQIDLTAAAPQSVLVDFLEQRLKEDQDGFRLGRVDRGLFRELVEGVSGDPGDLDRLVAERLPQDWPLDRLDRVLKLILRMGAFELANRQKTPARHAISEYVELAHDFFGGKEPGMVNAVLDRLGHGLRPAEFDAADGPAADTDDQG